MTGVWPASFNRLTVCDPMYPAPPATSTFMELTPLGLCDAARDAFEAFECGRKYRGRNPGRGRQESRRLDRNNPRAAGPGNGLLRVGEYGFSQLPKRIIRWHRTLVFGYTFFGFAPLA